MKISKGIQSLLDISMLIEKLRAYSAYLGVIGVTAIVWGIASETPLYGIVISFIGSIVIGFPVFYIVDKFLSRRK